MSITKRLLVNNFKKQIAFPANLTLEILYNFLWLVIQVLIWRGLYRGGGDVMGVALNEMVAYMVLSSLTNVLRDTPGVMTRINAEVQDGSIVQRMLMPVGFRRYFLMNTLAQKPANLVLLLIPQLAFGVLVFGASIQLTLTNALVYIISMALAFAICFSYDIIMGLTVLWFKNSFFLDWVDGLFWTLLTGQTVPLWFFPGWLGTASKFLPFRYMFFEPHAILLGKTPLSDAPRVLAIQLFWAVALYALSSLIWSRGRRHLLVNGG